jgi:hypothetical protein
MMKMKIIETPASTQAAAAHILNHSPSLTIDAQADGSQIIPLAILGK